MQDQTVTAITLTMIITLYLLPGLIASVRNHYNATAIWILNIFAGWTALGWLIALVWAFTHDPKPAKEEKRI